MTRYWIKALPNKQKPLKLGDMIASVGLICPEHLLQEHQVDFSEWLLCEGQFLYCHQYPELFAEIGFIFGTLDHTQFRVPFLNIPFLQHKQGE